MLCPIIISLNITQGLKSKETLGHLVPVISMRGEVLATRVQLAGLSRCIKAGVDGGRAGGSGGCSSQIFLLFFQHAVCFVS